jgi:hypothetical protein
VKETYPRLTIDTRLLHLIEPRTDSHLGGELDRTNLLVDSSLKVPIYRVGPLLPSALAGFRFNSDFGSGNGLEAGVENLYLGGTLGANIADTVHLEAGGAYMFTGDWMVMLHANLLH